VTIEVYTGPTAKEFRFMVEINGFPAAMVQSFDPGSRHHAVAERGGAGMNHPFKEAGMITFDNCILYAVRPLEGTCRMFWDAWMDQAQNPRTGGGGSTNIYMKNFTLYELDNNRNPVTAEEYFQAFPIEHKQGKKDSLSKDRNVIDEIHIAYVWKEPRLIGAGA
jgi:hypothetical protein